MMTSSIFLLCCLCLLTFTSYLLTQHTSYSLNVMPARKLSTSAPTHEHKYHNAQVAVEEMESTPAKEDSMTVEYKGNSYSYSYSPHDLVYHTDYHGVTTHPTPKHPKP